MMLRAFIVAAQFLTRVPTPQIHDFRPDDLSRAAGFFPLVGFLIGVALWLAAVGGGMIGGLVAGLFVVIVWIAITGGLHIDGLADVADALGAAHRSPDRFVEVLRDPHVGTFGVLAIVLSVLAKFVLVSELARLGAGLVGLLLVPAWARWGAVFIAHWVEPLVAGSGSRFKWAISAAAIWGNLAVLVIVSAVFAPALLVAPFVVGGLALYWRVVTGGITGDCLGASIEVTEGVLLTALVVVAVSLG